MSVMRVLHGLLKQRVYMSTPARFYCTANEHVTCTKLNSRGLILASGKDVTDFLQGLITNDMECINMRCGVPAMYSMFLNTKGRVMNDLILYHCRAKSPEDIGSSYVIECDKHLQDDFLKLIGRYRIRKQVALKNVSDSLDVWAVFPQELCERRQSVDVHYNETKKSSIVVESHDPRCKPFGRRLILPKDVSATDVIDGIEVTNIEAYDTRRFFFGIGEGRQDLPPGNALPLDSNVAFLNGVSFDKGCYIGQELTARTHHTGVVRKRLMPIKFESDQHDCQPDADVHNKSGKKCGKIRDFRGKYGLAMLRIPDVINKGPLSVANARGESVIVTTRIPWWWPTDNDPIIKQVLHQTVSP